MMATAAAGANPPPDPGNGNTNNGNTFPAADIEELLESISDINLRLLQLGNKFLSAKNSVELHKSKGHRMPCRSLPSVFNSEDNESCNSSGSGQSSQEPTDDYFSPTASPTRSNQGRSVNWADLHSSHGYQILADHQNHLLCTNSRFKLSTVVENSESSTESTGLDVDETSAPLDRNYSPPTHPLVVVNESASHDSLHLNNPPLSEDVSVSVLLAPTQINPFISEKSVMDIDMFEQTFVNLHNSSKPKRSLAKAETGAETDAWNHQQFIHEDESLVPIPMPPNLIPRGVIGIGQSPNIRQSLSGNLIDDFTPSCVINNDDGLEVHSGIDIRNRDSPQSVCFSPVMDNLIFQTESITHYHEYCGLPVTQLAQVNDPPPVSVYFEESFNLTPTPKPPIGDQPMEHDQLEFSPLSPQQEDDQKHSSNYDTDDDLDVDKSSQFVMKTADELPVPDPQYIAATVSENLRPMIAKRYKKDCRTWLWKSKAQREARLKQQREDEVNQVVPDSTALTTTPRPETMTEEQLLLEKEMRELQFNTYYS